MYVLIRDVTRSRGTRSSWSRENMTISSQKYFEMFTLELSSYSRTYNSYWKLNSVLLEDEEICRSVISRITYFFNKAQAKDNFVPYLSVTCRDDIGDLLGTPDHL